TIPAGSNSKFEQVKMVLNGTDVTGAFAVRPNGRYMGVVEGLKNGQNVLVANLPNNGGANLAITNAPIGGPVISGPQVPFWECTTKVASPTATNPDLGDPVDAQCNIKAPVYRYQYRTLNNTFAAYDP